jgi:uncharacterized Ntn-hydrolase superfamily protein
VADLYHAPMATRQRSSATLRRGRQGTYSIVARDPASGELGVAVQSHWFSVGPLVPWALPGVGAVATQANVEVAYGHRALSLLAEGLGAQEALSRLIAADDGADGRQVAVVDSAGGVAAHTGSACMPEAGHATGDGVSCQANIMADRRVWGAMLETYEAATGSLTDKLLDALDAAEAAGGDLRGRQSAAILVVPASGDPWESTVSLRVEDHPEPLVELRRLVRLHDAYVIAGDGDACVNEGRYDDASRKYVEAAKLAPDNHELRFWAGLGTAQLGDVDAGVALVREAIAIQPGWTQLIERLTDEALPSVGVVRERLAG